MQLLTVAVCLFAVACGLPTSPVVAPAPALESIPWTLAHLSEALQNPETNPAVVPYLEAALNDVMTSLMAGEQVDVVMVAMPVGEPLEVAAVAPAKPELVVVAPAMESTPWTLAHLTEALQNPSTNPALVPYLEAALNDVMIALMNGQNVDIVMVAMPAGEPLEVAAVAPAVPEPVVVAPAMESTPWTLAHLSEALQNPNTNPALVPYLEAALNDVMTALMNGQNVDIVMVAMPAGEPLEVVAVAPAVPEPVVVAPAMESTPWTLAHLSEALQNPNTNPALVPYLEAALNDVMTALMNGQNVDIVMVAMPAGEPLEVVAVAPAVLEPVVVAPAMESTPWTLAHLSEALQNPNTNPALVPYLEAALNDLMTALMNGQNVDIVMVAMPAGEPLEIGAVAPAVPEPVVVAPAMESTPWTLAHLSDALQNPNTNPALVPYLEAALNDLMTALMNGQNVDIVMVAMPAGVPLELPLTPVESPVVPVETPVAPVETPVVPVETPVVPAAPESTPDFSGPLVQIILNINVDEQQVSGGAASTPITIDPVSVIEQALSPVSVVEHAPEPVQVVEQVPAAPVNPIDVVAIAAPEPEPVIVAPANPIDVIAVAAPEPVAPANPIDVIAVAAPEPVAPANPIDVIAVAAPEINPIDLLQPIPVPAVAGGDFGILV